ncbi:hypothetical protein AB0A95_30980 [Micromonospora sp. NPDC049230]|uniref:hypothetical protein n=1 Tax=Micromonospora sp. NPDC049230 TaxID=3155502 RepID=UPI0033CB3345
MIIAICSAARHGTWYALRNYGCQCPEAVEDDRRRSREKNRCRPYIRGRNSNKAGGRSGLDPIAVERAVAGDRTLRLTTVERRAAIDRLDSFGYTAAEVAVRLGITCRTVQRQRARRRSSAASRTKETGIA